MIRSRSGFSLLELLVGMALASLVLAMGLLQTSRATDAAQTRGLAELIAEEMRAARRQAVASGQPVAVGFPSAAGQSAHSNGLYVLQGVDKPRVTRGRRFDGDFPEACAFIGVWPVSGFTTSRSALPLAGNVAGFDLSAWPVPFPKDYLFVFAPSGHLLTNGLAHYDRRYHILVSQGVAYGPGATPAGSSPFKVSYFQPSEVSNPYTVSLSPGGEVEVAPGVPHSSLGGAGRVETAAAPALPAPVTTNSPPVLVAVRSDPRPPELPVGVDAVIPPLGYLTLDVQVSEPDGQVPYLLWEKSDGTLSSDVATAMEWNATNRRWEGRWVWSPPEGALPGQEYTLRYKVDDGHGGVITGSLGATGKVRVGQRGLIAHTSYTDSGVEVGIVTPDGVERRLLTPESDDIVCLFPTWQPGGNQLACHGSPKSAGDDDDPPSGIYVVNRDGSGFHEVDSAPDSALFEGHINFPCTPVAWSPDGTRIAYSRSSGGGCCIFVINADGSGKVRLTAPSTNRLDRTPCWNSLGTALIFERVKVDAAGDWVESKICRVADTGGTVTDLFEDPDHTYSFPQYADGDSQIVFMKDYSEIQAGNANGTGVPSKISNHTTPALLLQRPVLSPDGTLVAYNAYGVGALTYSTRLYVTTLSGKDPDNPTVDGAKTILSKDFDFTDPLEWWPWTHEPTWSPDSRSMIHLEANKLVVTNVLGTLQPRSILESGISVGGWNTPSWTR